MYPGQNAKENTSAMASLPPGTVAPLLYHQSLLLSHDLPLFRWSFRRRPPEARRPSLVLPAYVPGGEAGCYYYYHVVMLLGSHYSLASYLPFYRAH